ncbi:MAG: carboxypeptidase-like regulatory domain-containing protein [Sphingopyxis sp.]|nr:carboxypeptidase-like regulatory domain-containing protein [Sphingopyxis sp.]
MKIKGLHLIGAAAGTAAALLPGGAQARIVTNVAQALWNGPNGPVAVPSNRVDIRVNSTPTPIQTEIYSIAAPGGSGQPSRLDGSGCSAGGQGSLSSGGGGSGTTDVSLNPADRFTAGQPIAFGIRSPSENVNPAARDSFQVVVRTANNDEETVTLREDANNSGFFVGFLATMRTPPAVVRNDCRLSVDPGNPLEVTLARPGTSDTLARAMVNFLVDPFGIVFDSGDGTPVPGSRVTLINDATGQPAEVFGDDGVSRYPSSVITGATVTDAGGTVYTFPPGDYRFPLVAPGTYRLVVEPPTPYRWPSTVPIPELLGFRRPDNGEPYTLGTASYGRSRCRTPCPAPSACACNRCATMACRLPRQLRRTGSNFR